MLQQYQIRQISGSPAYSTHEIRHKSVRNAKITSARAFYRQTVMKFVGLSVVLKIPDLSKKFYFCGGLSHGNVSWMRLISWYRAFRRGPRNVQTASRGPSSPVQNWTNDLRDYSRITGSCESVHQCFASRYEYLRAFGDWFRGVTLRVPWRRFVKDQEDLFQIKLDIVILLICEAVLGIDIDMVKATYGTNSIL